MYFALLNAVAGDDYTKGTKLGQVLCRSFISMVVCVLVLISSTSSAQSLFASVLPTSRSVQVGITATAFATLINAGSGTAISCGLAPLTTVPAIFTYQTTNRTTNAVTGTINTPVDIPAGQSQTFVFAFTPTAAFGPTDVQLGFACTNASPAMVITGVNTLLLSASPTPIPDIIALAATLTQDGIANVDPNARVGVFAVATSNVGSSGVITATADTGGVNLPLSLSLCETNPATGDCVASPSASVTSQINANATPTFGIFITEDDTIPFDPATNRIFVRFASADGVTRGSTSVAVRSVAGREECVNIAGKWHWQETGSIACTFDGNSEREPVRGSDVININQDGCNVSWTVPSFNVNRAGTIQGTNIQVSGPSAVPLVGTATFTRNTFSGQGIINGDEFTLHGSGTATGTVNGISFSCTSTSTAKFTRSKESEDGGAFAGTYIGTFSGNDSGTFTVVVDTAGQITGSGVSREDGPFRITGTVNSAGGVELVAGTATTGATFSGAISAAGEISGTWENRFLGARGTFTGRRQ